MALTLLLLILTVVTGEKLRGEKVKQDESEAGTKFHSQPFLSTLTAKRSGNEEDTGMRNDPVRLWRGGRFFPDSEIQTNSFSRPFLATKPPHPSPSSAYNHSPSSTAKPSPLQSLSSLVSQGLGVFSGSNPTISLPGLTSSLAGILSEGLGLAQTFPHAGGFSRVDSLVSGSKPNQLLN